MLRYHPSDALLGADQDNGSEADLPLTSRQPFEAYLNGPPQGSLKQLADLLGQVINPSGQAQSDGDRELEGWIAKSPVWALCARCGALCRRNRRRRLGKPFASYCSEVCKKDGSKQRTKKAAEAT